MFTVDWYKSRDRSDVQWFDGTEHHEGYTRMGTNGTVESKINGESMGIIKLNADGSATNAATGEAASASVSGKTKISGKIDNTVTDLVGLASNVTDLAGGVALSLGENKVGSIIDQMGDVRISGGMGGTLQAAKSSMVLGKAMSGAATGVSALLLANEANNVYNGQADAGRLGYHATSFVASGRIGLMFGGAAGAIAGLAGAAGE